MHVTNWTYSNPRNQCAGDILMKGLGWGEARAPNSLGPQTVVQAISLQVNLCLLNPKS